MEANGTTSLADLLNYELGTNFVEIPPEKSIPYQLALCTSFPASTGLTSEPFHLLACGHIVHVNDQDHRCGLNCHHVSLPHDGFAPEAASNSTFPALPPISGTQHRDWLYCEICDGIPFDRYIIMKPPSTTFLPNNNPSLRRCLGLTRILLQTYIRLPDADVDASISRMSFGQTVPGFNAHTLLCKHEILGDVARPCAVNCAAWKACRGNIPGSGGVRGCGPFLCGECVMRAELVHKRCEKSDMEMAVRAAEDVSAMGYVGDW